MRTSEPPPGLPDDLSEVSPQFLTAALRNGGVLDADGSVTAVAVERVGAGKALISHLARLHLTYADPRRADAPDPVILKMMPGAAEDGRGVGVAFGHFLREGRFYRDLAAVQPVRVPRCYWVYVAPDRHSSWLLLEDLSGWEAPCQLVGADLGVAERAVATLAQLHAFGWKAPLPEWVHGFDEPPHLTIGQVYRDCWEPFVRQHAHLLDQEAVDLGRRVKETFEQVQLVAVLEAPMTLCHGDFRLDNLLVDPDSGAIAVLDWQVVHRGPAVQDVAMFLAQSMDVHARRCHERHIVRTWHAALATALGDAAALERTYPFDRAWEHYRRMVLFGTAYPVVLSVSIDPQNERGRALMDSMIVRAFTAAVDLDCGALA